MRINSNIEIRKSENVPGHVLGTEMVGRKFLSKLNQKKREKSFIWLLHRFLGLFLLLQENTQFTKSKFWVNQNSLCQALSSVLPVSWILVFFISCVSNISIEKIKILKDGSIQTIIAIIFFSSILSLILFINGINVHYEWLVTEKIAVSIFVGYSQFPENS